MIDKTILICRKENTKSFYTNSRIKGRIECFCKSRNMSKFLVSQVVPKTNSRIFCSDFEKSFAIFASTLIGAKTQTIFSQNVNENS